MKNVLYSLTISITALITGACTDSDPSATEDTFARIYDFNTFDESFFPREIVETSDEGFIILAARRKETDEVVRSVYLLKLDKSGEVVSDFPMPGEFVHPLSGLTLLDDKVFFICMDDQARAVIVSISQDFTTHEISRTNLHYPASATYLGGGDFLLLSYNHIDNKTVLSRIGSNGVTKISREFRISDGDSMQDVIMQHFLDGRIQFPFACGQFSDGTYYFNGFFDYTFSFVTTRLRDDNDVIQFIHGQHENGGMSAVLPTGPNSFAAAYFNFTANYFIPSVSLPSAPSSISLLGGYQVREVVPNSDIVIRRFDSGGKSLLAYSANMKSKQIGLYFYGTDGKLIGTKYLGFSNPYELGSFVQTTDGGFAVCGTTFIAGRFPRVSLHRFSKSELDKIIR